MIVSRAPVRITLGGGGTDLPSYYIQHGGFCISAAIDSYVFVSANRRFYDSIRLGYSDTEIVDSVPNIKHRIFREALKLLKIEKGIELVSIADVPASCGLGTSSSFTVSLLNALHAYKRDYVSQRQLAEEACHVEIDILGEPIGKQDQFSASFGGINCYTFSKDGSVGVEPLQASEEVIDKLESNLSMFYTGIERSASSILVDQDKQTRDGDLNIIKNLSWIKEIGYQTKEALESGKVDALGELFHDHWVIKRRRSEKIFSPFIDECYEVARQNGATGSKLIGAGGGGFFLVYTPNSEKALVYCAMKKLGLRPMKFHFDYEGAKILANMKRG